MSSSKFIKDNFALVLGIALPVLLMVGFMVAANMPTLTGEPPKYDFVFSIADTNYGNNQIPIAVKLTVAKGGELRAQYTKTPPAQNGYNYNAWKKLYVYEAASHKVRELPFPYPADMDKMTGTTEEPVDATKGMKLDTTQESPDGYSLSYDGYSSGGLVNDVFMGSRYNSEPRLRKGNSSVPLRANDSAPFYYHNIEFIGWATGNDSGKK
ncbi:MAG: hypothetical protein PW788_01155 [Micavibrio sp.]|nr:hypothetical protein [Micavibrio sp.]